eukprot:CAMPEP_0118701786 /NCGR_PEP_ID=MMETSP0800-20121206/17471_1 /TAXON_ID=210618 ORGANISM="Striatella unipunctata, Strain CCMP2910" /NCGR_SAMPLE_ID=MMETSP0800 /ASSEMBLY_ACC=CAM_ASM_000638 /LENGTH=52 /DNA_ID=CAMNT_0006602799 /DNA_START=207 /DNA_END=361 /DNA_ORIENTATION=-
MSIAFPPDQKSHEKKGDGRAAQEKIMEQIIDLNYEMGSRVLGNFVVRRNQLR